ncbi:probable inactive ribonuclease-like protein 13 [Sciurus carolinensis]|nr:probable inactive ribonuclease-like protein 13 [Sciurus carolinensis]XP_047397472.1 probable inactive ribonuclease-like protein 13 [Sciurus carolinensis]XP_047397473.1 probable inactive ribonuclease-like protein 13 [Sciurus carolinensis]
MVPAVIQLLFLQLVLGPTLVMTIQQEAAVQNFRTLNMDYPKVNFPGDFEGYCNGFMSYVRGRKQHWYCPTIHYVIHAPWKTIWKSCKNSESFCENYNEYCTLTKVSFPLTICKLYKNQPPTSCHYSSTETNGKIYLLCSSKYEGQPIDILGLYKGIYK